MKEPQTEFKGFESVKTLVTGNDWRLDEKYVVYYVFKSSTGNSLSFRFDFVLTGSTLLENWQTHWIQLESE